MRFHIRAYGFFIVLFAMLLCYVPGIAKSYDTKPGRTHSVGTRLSASLSHKNHCKHLSPTGKHNPADVVQQNNGYRSNASHAKDKLGELLAETGHIYINLFISNRTPFLQSGRTDVFISATKKLIYPKHWFW